MSNVPRAASHLQRRFSKSHRLAPTALQSITMLAEQARAAHARFLEAVPTTQRRVAAARGASSIDNRAIDAQVALSALESLRSQTAIVLGDVDNLYSEAVVEGRVRPPLEDARSIIVDMVADEDTTLAALRGQLRN